MNKREINSNIIEQLCDEAYEIFHGEPDLIIFGEVRTYAEHTREQARSVIRNRPEYILSEGYGNRGPEKSRMLLALYKFMTVREIMAQLKLPLSLMRKRTVIEDLQRQTRELYRGMQGEIFDYQLEIEKIPGNLHDLFETPIYDLPITAYFQLIEYLKECLGEVSRKIDASDLDPAFKSTFLKKLSAVSYLITLSEHMNLYERRNSPLLHAIANVGGQLAGCDIDKKDMPKVNGPDDQEPDDDLGQKLTQFLEVQKNYVDENNELREKTMGERMVHFNKLRKTKRPNIAIVGKYHLRSQSEIHAILKRSRVKYRCILQRKKLFPDKEQKFKDDTYGLEIGMK